MNSSQEQRYHYLYKQHLITLRLQGKRPSTIDAYARAVGRITAFFDRAPDTLTTADLKIYFNSLIQTHSWSTIKIDRNGLQFLPLHSQQTMGMAKYCQPPTSKAHP
jgi:hypothetical protein